MKKKLIGGLVVLVIAIGAGFHFATPPLLEKGVELGGTSALGTDVTLEGASISAISGRASLQGFRIANLEGFHEPELFRADIIAVEVSPLALLSEPIAIGEIVIEAPVFTLEANLDGVNLSRLLAHLEKGGGTPGAEGTGGGAQEAPTELEIQRVRITDPQVILAHSVGGTDREVIELETIEITDLHTADGRRVTTLPRLCQRILSGVLEAVAEKNRIPKEVLDLLRSDAPVLESVIDPVRKGVDTAADVIEGAGEGLRRLLGPSKKD